MLEAKTLTLKKITNKSGKVVNFIPEMVEDKEVYSVVNKNNEHCGYITEDLFNLLLEQDPEEKGNKALIHRALGVNDEEKEEETLIFGKKIILDVSSTNDIDDFEKIILSPVRQARAYNRAVRDASFYCLLNFIEYKAKRNGKMLAKIDPAYTSKTCHRCDHINYNLTVNDRVFNCPSCGLVMDRDEQSNINIHNIGMKSLGLGISLQTINVKPFKIVKLSSLQLGSSHLFRCE